MPNLATHIKKYLRDTEEREKIRQPSKAEILAKTFYKNSIALAISIPFFGMFFLISTFALLETRTSYFHQTMWGIWWIEEKSIIEQFKNFYDRTRKMME